MKKILIPILILFCIHACGCSMPTSTRYSQLYSLTRQEQKIKGRLGSSKKVLVIEDFRENDMYEEDITRLKEKVEEYIANHADLSDSAKNNLREFKVAEGANKEEVTLLLGKPDKIIKRDNQTNHSASEIWIYRISKIRAFTIFIFPVFFVHEGYYLYFNDTILTSIKKHYLEQIIRQGAGPGVNVKSK